MVTVMVGGSPTPSTWLLAVGVIGCFLANEPLLVLLGQRGTRTRREDGKQARLALLLFALVALGAGISGLVMAPPDARLAVGLPLLFGSALFTMAVKGRERTMLGEGLAAAALSSTAVPLGLSAELSLSVSLAVALIWLITSLLGTAVVRLTVARTKAKSEEDLQRVRLKRVLLILVCFVVIAVGLLAPFGSRVGLWVLAAALPVALVVLVIAALRPTARRLRLMGWSLVAASLCSLIAVVTTLRIIQDFEAVESTLPFPMF